MSSHERDLTRGPISEHLRALAIPAAISLLSITLYNVTDTFFAGLVSAEAQAGLGVGSQIFFGVTAVGIGLRVGLSALVGQELGRKDPDAARLVAARGLGVTAGFTVLAMIAGYALLPSVIAAVTAAGAYRDAAIDYVLWLLLAAPGFVITPALSGILAGQGDTQTFARGQTLAAAANVFLDPLFIFGIDGVVPGFGLDGIAFATVACQSGLMVYMIGRTAGSSVLTGVAPGDLVPTARSTSALLDQSLPASMTLLVTVFGGLVAQSLLMRFGETAVAAYGVGFRLEQLLLLPALGVTSALLPIVSQNMGARKLDRVREAFWGSIRTGLTLMAAGAALIWLLGPFAVGAFSASPEVADLALSYLRIETLALPCFVVLYAVQSVLQGIGKPRFPVVVSLWRQGLGLGLFGVLFTGPLGLGVVGMWWAVAISVFTGTVMLAVGGAFIARRQGLVSWGPADQ
ncbi:MAG: MATE family efflux transporter [Myxococcota bacterium]